MSHPPQVNGRCPHQRRLHPSDGHAPRPPRSRTVSFCDSGKGAADAAHQNVRGGWEAPPRPGLSAIVVRALVPAPRPLVRVLRRERPRPSWEERHSAASVPDTAPRCSATRTSRATRTSARSFAETETAWSRREAAALAWTVGRTRGGCVGCVVVVVGGGCGEYKGALGCHAAMGGGSASKWGANSRG